MVKPKYLDEGEIQSLQMQLDAAKPDDRVAIVGRIAKSFGGSSSEVFKRLSPKDPVMAHMGVLLWLDGRKTRSRCDPEHDQRRQDCWSRHSDRWPARHR